MIDHQRKSIRAYLQGEIQALQQQSGSVSSSGRKQRPLTATSAHNTTAAYRNDGKTTTDLPGED